MPMEQNPKTPEAEAAAKADREEFIKRYRGRPSKYDPKFCDMVVEWGREGKSRTWMAAQLLVIRETFDNWAKDHPEFFDALTLAKQLEQLWWEDKGQDCISNSGFQSSVWSRSMAARFPVEWRNKSEVDHGLSADFQKFLDEIDGDSSSLV